MRNDEGQVGTLSLREGELRGPSGARGLNHSVTLKGD